MRATAWEAGLKGVEAVQRKWESRYLIKVSSPEEDRVEGIDLWFERRPPWSLEDTCVGFPVQVKNDLLAQRTNKLFLQFMKRFADGRLEFSGLLKTQAKIWIQVTDFQSPQMYEFEAEALRSCLVGEWAKAAYELRETEKGHPGVWTMGLLLPLDKLEKSGCLSQL